MTSHATVRVMVGTDGPFDVEFPDEVLERSVFDLVSIARITFSRRCGHKPSFGRAPAFPQTNPAVCVGPIARSVADVARLLNIIAQPDSRDPTALPFDDITLSYHKEIRIDIVGLGRVYTGLPILPLLQPHLNFDVFNCFKIILGREHILMYDA